MPPCYRAATTGRDLSAHVSHEGLRVPTDQELKHPAALGMCRHPLNTSTPRLLTAKEPPELFRVFMSSFGLGLSVSMLGFPGSIPNTSHKQVISLRMVLIKAYLCIVPLEFLFSWLIKYLTGITHILSSKSTLYFEKPDYQIQKFSENIPSSIY